MSTYAGDRELQPHGAAAGAWRNGLDWLLALELHTSMEFWLYTGLLVVAFLLRFTDLGARALHHDESLHATYSWYLATGKGYTHDPLMHGPFLFHITALIYLLFGASDATSRFAPALFGTALVLVPFLLRPWLGRIGAFATAAFLAVSPSLLYYDRFIRNEAWVTVWTLGMVVCLFRYRATRGDRYLYAAAALLMLQFCSKETAFIISAIMLLYLDGATAADLVAELSERHGLGQLQRLGLFLVLLPTAWLVAAGRPLLQRVLPRWIPDELPASGVLLLVLGLLTAPQFSAAVRVPLQKLHYDIMAVPGYTLAGRQFSRVAVVGGLTVIALLLVTFLVGLWWDQRRWLICAAIFYVPYFLLYTTFLTNPNGWGSGIWGSLSYWLDQQGVQRGNQPALYYGMVLPTYEYLMIGLGFLGLFWQAARRGLDSVLLLVFSLGLIPVVALVNGRTGNYAAIPLVLASIGAAVGAMRGDRLRQFLVFHFGALLFGLSVAGEKMPWLTVHLAMPVAVLAGMAVNDAFQLTARMKGSRLFVITALVATGLAAAALAAALSAKQIAAGQTLLLVVAAVVLAGVLYTSIRLVRQLQVSAPGTRWAARLGGMTLVAGFAGFLGLLTVRADARLNFYHGDTPDEMLIYTQTAPDVAKVAKLIDQLAVESGQGNNLRITVDSTDAFTWPWAWYLRKYTNVSYPDMSLYQAKPGGAVAANPGEVLILNAQNQAEITAFPGQYDSGRRLHHRWWFPEEGYKGVTTANFVTRLRNGSEFRRWWGYITNRSGFAVPPSDISPQGSQPAPGAPPALAAKGPNGSEYLGSVDSVVYFPAGWTPGRGFGATAGANGAPGSARSNGTTLTVGATGSAGGQFRRPVGLAVDVAGNVYIADSLNNRIQKLDRNGTFLAQSGQVGSDLPLQEPWGLAVDKAGFVYVADTWSHRVVKLDGNLRQVASWGQPDALPGAPTSLLELYGPRSIAIDGAGNLWVTDTGNARVIEFDPNGKPLGSFGQHGKGPGQFDEPVGIATAQDGSFYVADEWNNRIQHFDPSFAYLSEFPVTWVDGSGGGRGSENKPYLAVLPDGTIITTFPEANRLVQYDLQGRVIRSIDKLPGMTTTLKRPEAIATDLNGDILLSDGLLNEVVKASLRDLP